MIAKRTIRFTLMLILIFVFAFSLLGCSGRNDTAQKIKYTPSKAYHRKQLPSSQPNPPNFAQVVDNEIQQKILNMKGVKNAVVYTQNNTAVATITLDSSISKENAKKIGNKVAKELKAKYKSYRVTVQAFINDKEWINVNLD
jgi:hypothetical protein